MTSLLIANIIQSSNFCRLIETVINSHIRESLFAMMNLLTNNPDEIVRLITETHEQLSKQRDLSPNNDLVNFQLSRLVNFVTQTHHEQDAKKALKVLADRGLVKKMRDLCQEAEFQLEKYYSSAILELSKN